MRLHTQSSVRWEALGPSWHQSTEQLRAGKEKTLPSQVSSRHAVSWASYRNAMVFTPEISNRLRQRTFLQATLSSSSTM
jgi:hypothetical protein